MQSVALSSGFAVAVSGQFAQMIALNSNALTKVFYNQSFIHIGEPHQ